jgi:hypothetical protein
LPLKDLKYIKLNFIVIKIYPGAGLAIIIGMDKED